MTAALSDSLAAPGGSVSLSVMARSFRNILHTMLLALLFTATATAQMDTSFIEGFGDVPLLDGMHELADERLIFDTPAGTYAEALFTSPAPGDELISRYRAALTSLGWHEAPVRGEQAMVYSFTRERETLSLRITKSAEHTLLRIQLTPK